MYLIDFLHEKAFYGVLYICVWDQKEGEGRDIGNVLNEGEGRLEKDSVKQKV